MNDTPRKSFVVRPTAAADASRLPAIERSAAQVFLSAPGLEWIAGDQVRSAQTHRLFIDSGLSWVAVDGAGTVAGFLLAERCGLELHIAEIAVQLEMQGIGCGSALMEAAIAWARARTLRAVTLTTFSDVAWNAPFYRRFGFQDVETGSDPRLDGLLRLEIARGLPAERRCAMRLVLSG